MANNAVKILLHGIGDPSYAWLSQANHIFNRLGFKSNLGEYHLVDTIFFEVKILETTEEPPAGFLFLCPKEHFRVGPSTFCWPACPAYWSLDPSGANRLSTDEATQLGFPAFQLNTTTNVQRWDDSAYAGLRQFHRAKGFDPDSQDVARHLNHPLYQVHSNVDHLFAIDDLEEEEVAFLLTGDEDVMDLS
ncbi:hypothetical protein DFH06DRAFT_1166421 [Mycena polygramma]|nr:hypothetical protein DFH06DRAFT_1166421 [Mycena polygramma]